MKKICTILMCLILSGPYIKADQIPQSPNQIQGSCVEKRCERGKRGHRGPTGNRGHGRRGRRGHRGKQGTEGPPGQPLVIEYGNASLQGQVDPAQLTLGLVPLDVAGPHSTNVSFDTTTHLFTVASAGTYVIEYYVQAGFEQPHESEAQSPQVPVGIAVVINGIHQGIGLMSLGTFDGGPIPSPSAWKLSERVMQTVQKLNANTTVGLTIDSIGIETWYYGKGVTPNLVAFLTLRKIA